MTGIASDAHDDPGVLYGVILKIEFRPDRPDLGTLRMLQHRFKPVAVDDLYVVVHQHHVLTSRLFDPEVHDGWKIEWLVK